jgi:ubiquilin
MSDCVISSLLADLYPSGRCPVQDDDQLSVYKIQSSHTIHMVKGAVRSTTATTSGPPSTPQPLPNMQTGQNVHDPLTQLNSHMGYGLMAGLNPFADMGVNPNDPNMVCRHVLFAHYTDVERMNSCSQ